MQSDEMRKYINILTEAPKGQLWKIKYSYDDPSGKGVASGTISLHAPTKELAKSYALKDLTHSKKKNVKIGAATQSKELKD